MDQVVKKLCLFLAFILLSLSSLAEVDSYALWQAGVAYSAEQLILGNHQEAVIEQDIEINTSVASVMNVLADIQNYTDLYPLFDIVDLHKVYQSSELEVISEFTAIDREEIGPFVAEDQYFSVSVVNYEKSRVELNIWQLDQVFINIRIDVEAKNNQVHLMLTTHIQAADAVLQTILLNELNMPTLRVDLLKMLLEEGVISSYGRCVSQPNQNRYCF